MFFKIKLNLLVFVMISMFLYQKNNRLIKFTIRFFFHQNLYFPIQNMLWTCQVFYVWCCVGSKYPTFVTFDKRAILSIQGYNFCPFYHITEEAEPSRLYFTFCDCLHIFIIFCVRLKSSKFLETFIIHL